MTNLQKLKKAIIKEIVEKIEKIKDKKTSTFQMTEDEKISVKTQDFAYNLALENVIILITKEDE